ncbi:MAG: beta-propeller fold lactonase family protein, partial [Microbacterium sp.]
MRFWLGGYGADEGGSASGIGVLVAGAPDDALAGGQLSFGGTAARVDGSPSWLAAHPTQDVVYVAIEDAGVVRAFRRTGETSFAPLGAAVAAGEALCHVAVAPDARSLIASCWGDGRVVRMSLGADGRPSTPVTAQPASDPYDPDAAPAEFAGGIDLASAARALRAAAGDEYAHLVPDYDAVPDDDAEPAATIPIPADDGGDKAESRVSRAHEAVFLPGGLV